MSWSIPGRSRARIARRCAPPPPTPPSRWSSPLPIFRALSTRFRPSRDDVADYLVGCRTERRHWVQVKTGRHTEHAPLNIRQSLPQGGVGANGSGELVDASRSGNTNRPSRQADQAQRRFMAANHVSAHQRQHGIPSRNSGRQRPARASAAADGSEILRADAERLGRHPHQAPHRRGLNRIIFTQSQRLSFHTMVPSMRRWPRKPRPRNRDGGLVEGSAGCNMRDRNSA